MDTAFERRTRSVLSTLSYGMITVAELELYDIANGRFYSIRHEGILWSPNNNRNYPISCLNCLSLAIYLPRYCHRVTCHLPLNPPTSTGASLYNIRDGRALATAARRMELAKNNIFATEEPVRTLRGNDRQEKESRVLY